MMRSLAMTILMLAAAGTLTAQTAQEARKLFYRSYTDEGAAISFRRLMQPAQDVPLMLGYKGMAEIMMCAYIINPFGKLSAFSKGKRMLERAIGSDPHNIELRFLRFTAQTNAPSILGYDTHITDDKKLLNTYLQQNAGSNTELYSMVARYMLRSDFCTANEKQLLKQYTQTP